MGTNICNFYHGERAQSEMSNTKTNMAIENWRSSQKGKHK